MEILKKKSIAVLTMSLIILLTLVLMTKTPIWEAAILLLVLLAVFAVIDFITGAKFFTEKQARSASIVVGVIAIAGIGIWGTISGTGTLAGGGENAGLADVPTPAAADETYELGLFYFERGDYEEAIQTLKEVTNSSGAYVEAQKLLAEATGQYRAGLMNTANTYVEKDDYKLAIDILSAGLLVIPEDTELLQTIEGYSSEYTNTVRTTAIADAETYAAEQDYENALMEIQGVVDKVGCDAELEALLNKYIVDYRNSVLMQAENLLQTEGYEVALHFVQQSLNVLPGDIELTNTIENIKDYAPVYLLDDIDYLKKDDRVYIETPPMADNKGVEYNEHKILRGGSQTLNYENYSIIFEVSGNYSKFSGTAFLPYQFRGSTRSAYIFIYGDGSLLYKTAPMSMGFETDIFTVDIKNINIVEIVFQSSPFSLNINVEDVYGCLTNAYFSK